MDNRSIAHARWNCTYHIVFIPKCRKRRVMYGKTKSGETDIFGHGGYYVATVGNVNEETILRYIQEQDENDKLEDGRK